MTTLVKMTTLVNEYTMGQKDSRPWGDWEVLDTGEGYAVKRIRVSPGGRLSLQTHEHRAEHWFVVSGTAHVTIGERLLDLAPGQSVNIDIGEVHRIENPGHEVVVIIELQRGAILRESDIVRIEDQYGRG
jgi:mannose-6-phosphate isomerase-like protein (cupin superfamily)